MYKWIAVVVLLAAVLHPVLESLDTWDAAAPGKDSDFVFLSLIVAAGLLCALGRLLVRKLAEVAPARLLVFTAARPPAALAALATPHFDLAPSPLRI